MFIIARYLKEVRLFFNDLYKSRRLIVDLAQREFRIKYSENYLGLAWAVLEPVAMMLILLLVFTYLRNRSHSSYPFVAYLLSGVVPFTFFSSSLSQATTSIKSFSFLLKQGSIRAGLLPLVNILSALKTHLIILCVAIGIFLGVGIKPSWYWLQLPYFTISSIILLVGLTWITSSLVLFVRDIQYLIGILMRTTFFLTPIFYELSRFPEQYHIYFKLNPLYHLVEGYRMCFLYHQPLWSDPVSLISFWCLTILSLVTGAFVFRKLRPEFADMVL